MAGEKPAGNTPANAGGGNANKGPNKNNRRRSLRSKRRGRKPEEGGEAREPRDSRDTRGEVREPRPPQPNAPKAVDKNVRDNRERRRRRRMRAKQRGPNETTTHVVEDVLKDLPPLVPSFVYTHVIRPSVRDSYEFRTEHFSKVTRKLEDFHIDLAPLYPEGGDEIKGVAYMPPLSERPYTEFDDDESLDDPNWDAEQSAEAALLEGEISDDFYAELDDSVLDEYPEEDIDA